MRRIRFVALGIVSFVVSIFGALLAPGTFLNRALSAALCTVFSFNSAVCTASLVQSSQRVVAATPPAVERSIADISGYLQAQRDPSEFGDEQPSAPSPGSNPQAPPFPQDPGPNFPVRREFDSPGSRSSGETAIRPGVLAMTDAKALSSDTFEFTLKSRENCILTATFTAINGESFFKSAKYIPSTPEACGSNTYSFEFQNKGTKIIATSSSRETVIFEQLSSETGRFIYNNGSGENTEYNFPLVDKSTQSDRNSELLLSLEEVSKNKGIVENWKNRYTQYESRISCGVLRGLCDLVPFMQAAAAIQAVAAPATAGASLVPASVTFLLHYLGSVGCFMVFGGIPPLPLGPVVGKGLGLGQFGQDTLEALGSGSSIIESHLAGAEIAGAQVPGFDGPWKDLCKKRTQPQQTAQQPEQEARECRVRWEDIVANNPPNRPDGTYINRGSCVIRGAVMTEQGLADGTNECGVCNTYIGGLKPKLGSCQAGSLSRMGIRRATLYCPPNWDSGW